MALHTYGNKKTSIFDRSFTQARTMFAKIKSTLNTAQENKSSDEPSVTNTFMQNWLKLDLEQCKTADTNMNKLQSDINNSNMLEDHSIIKTLHNTNDQVTMFSNITNENQHNSNIYKLETNNQIPSTNYKIELSVIDNFENSYLNGNSCIKNTILNNSKLVFDASYYKNFQYSNDDSSFNEEIEMSDDKYKICMNDDEYYDYVSEIDMNEFYNGSGYNLSGVYEYFRSRIDNDTIMEIEKQKYENVTKSDTIEKNKTEKDGVKYKTNENEIMPEIQISTLKNKSKAKNKIDDLLVQKQNRKIKIKNSKNLKGSKNKKPEKFNANEKKINKVFENLDNNKTLPDVTLKNIQVNDEIIIHHTDKRNIANDRKNKLTPNKNKKLHSLLKTESKFIKRKSSMRIITERHLFHSSSTEESDYEEQCDNTENKISKVNNPKQKEDNKHEIITEKKKTFIRKNEIMTSEDMKSYLNLKTIKFRYLPKKRVVKINEATFSEVYFVDKKIIKIVPLKHDTNEPDFLKESFIGKLLSNEDGIVHVHDIMIANGCYSTAYLQAWSKFTKKINKRPPRGKIDWGIITMEHGGVDLESFDFKDDVEIDYFFKTLLRILYNLEQKYEFEHRDLHWGNILLKRNNADSEKTHQPFKIKIIDFTLSRLKHKNKVAFTDLSEKKWLFEGDDSVDIQYNVYKRMKMNDYSLYNPKSNFHWFEYLLCKVEEKWTKCECIQLLKKECKRVETIYDLHTNIFR